MMFHSNFLSALKVQFRSSESTLVLLQWAEDLWVITGRISLMHAAQEKGFLALCLLAYKGFIFHAHLC